jgi:fatty-acyl-CoA synthase
VGAGEPGELRLRGPTVCAGYWKDPVATAKAISADGWFATGDLFRRDEDGYFHVVGRIREMYKSGGENVYPAEVERVLYDVPGVVEAAVIGVSDPKWGEVGHAFVALAAGAKTTADEILAACKVRLAKFKVPRKLQIMEALPKNASGKIDKKVLKEQVAAGSGC